ncbi:PTS transporter subunit EIIC [Borrelia parkeri]|uniref:Pts system, n-acetylglucosamine-specific iiabc component n=1 Tax=Borrelia parkeri SLO TaxID=1313294 RepID=A0ABN4C4L2_BORPR|nr:PTS transporter subunit EIIC [Borrelia parkeri]AHE63135.1 PTS sucrose transporter subunit IIBC [Borrelia parkeri HR1]AHH09095.1 Pts system, n-acetylglucosamine-specific iiabc component [Borrelia parkeri SLO]UPA10953.1 PTS transporter subunit EIIC [Borrelia parkeri]
MNNLMKNIQNLGKAVQTPAAVLPIAGLLLGFGYLIIETTEPSNMLRQIGKLMEQSGGAIFGNLPILFAIGTGMGLSKNNKAAAALGGAVGYLILNAGLSTFTIMINGKSEPVNMSVLGGIITGISSAMLSDRIVNYKIPQFLGFFSGQRLVPIANGLLSAILAIIFAFLWAPLQITINQIGNWMIEAGNLGVFVFGFLNRLLIITGLHQLLNTLVYFVFGEYTTNDGNIIQGEITRYLNGDPNAGAFTSGMYPVMLFGLPGAALAMYLTSKKERRKEVGGILLSASLTSFLTGITEPIEYTFMLIAPLLYLIHAILTGISLVITNILEIRIAFSLSAGIIDYFLMFPKSTNALLILPIGFVIGTVYFTIFITLIKTFKIKTPGREDNTKQQTISNNDFKLSQNEKFEKIIQALGGIDNITNIDSCFTRLRVDVKSSLLVNKDLMNQLGATGTIITLGNQVQVIFGAQSEQISNYIKSKT